MHDDLRRRALESGKTVSNKAKSKQSSKMSSKGHSKTSSRVHSRPQSRDVSDDEDVGSGNLSDETTHSVTSIEALLESDDFSEQLTDGLRQELHDCIQDLIDRKGSSILSRETSLTSYVRILTAHHLADALHGNIPDLLAAFLRSVKAESSEKETMLALRAISITAISSADETLYETVGGQLRRTISDSQSKPSKAAAIQCLGISIFFGGAGEDVIAENMTFLLEIVSSDGAYVGALDDVEVVASALQVYGFLATHVDDLEDESEDAAAAFLDQLDSEDAKVQIAAGENIALLYEKSYTPLGEDETLSDDEGHRHDGGTTGLSTPPSSSDDEEGHHPGDGTLVKRYDAYHNPNAVLDKIHSLASLSSKSMAKRTKKWLHQSFASIAITVKNPGVGLQTNNASKMTVRIHGSAEMKVDRWWKLMRLNMLRRTLAGGFVNHYYEGNQQVLSTLPMIMRQTAAGAAAAAGGRSPRPGSSGGGGPGGGGHGTHGAHGSMNKASKGRFRDSRRFVSGGAEEEGPE